jgi:DNA-binding NarL/FixJ family response regulator
VALAAELRPQVVLMDIRMPGSDGLAATKAITSDPDMASVRIIMLTTYQEDEQVFAALRLAPAGTWSRTQGRTRLRTRPMICHGQPILPS